MTIKEYCETAGITYCGKNLNDIAKMFQSIDYVDKQYEILPVGSRDIRLRWFDILEYNHATASVKYSWSQSVSPFLFNLIHAKNGYAQYRIREGLVLESEYAFKLFELLKIYIGQKKSTALVEIAELKALFDANEYKQYNDFRRYFLDIAVKDINKFTSLRVSYTPRKIKGRGYSHIMFTIREEEDILGFIEDEQNAKLDRVNVKKNLI
jgi:plasmid replication initiation protein